MKLTDRYRRAIRLLEFAVIGVLRYTLMTDTPGGPTSTVSAADSISIAERRLDKLRQTASLVPGREEVLKRVSEQLAQREKRVLTADTAAQAQAQLLS